MQGPSKAEIQLRKANEREMEEHERQNPDRIHLVYEVNGCRYSWDFTPEDVWFPQQLLDRYLKQVAETKRMEEIFWKILDHVQDGLGATFYG